MLEQNLNRLYKNQHFPNNLLEKRIYIAFGIVVESPHSEDVHPTFFYSTANKQITEA